MSETKNLRIGLIGIGSMGRHHARVIRETPGMDLVAIADPGGDRFGVAGDLEVLPNVEGLIEAGLDAAMVAVPTVYHLDTALKLAAAGVHTMVEKPIANTAQEGIEMARAFKDAGLIGAVGYVERCNPAIRALRERIAAGELGQVYQILTRRQGPFPARITDVGVVKDLATHDVDLTAFAAQSPYKSISAQTFKASGREYEDMVVATGRLENGVIVNHVVNWLSPMKERLTVVTGEKGAFVADTLTGDLTFYENGTIRTEWDAIANFRGVTEGDVTRYAVAKREPLRVEQEIFRDAILGQENDLVTMDDGVHTMRVVEGILESAASGKNVEL